MWRRARGLAALIGPQNGVMNALGMAPGVARSGMLINVGPAAFARVLISLDWGLDRDMATLLADKYEARKAEVNARFEQLRANEEELNRIF